MLWSTRVKVHHIQASYSRTTKRFERLRWVFEDARRLFHFLHHYPQGQSIQPQCHQRRVPYRTRNIPQCSFHPPQSQSLQSLRETIHLQMDGPLRVTE
jgi:hypothetical protein